MTLTEQRPPVHVPHPYTRRAWVALAVTPLAFAVAIVVAFAASGAGPGVGGALLGLLALAAPTAAIVLASYAVAGQEPSSRTVLTTAVTAFLLVGVLLPVLAISAVAWIIALAVAVVVLALFGRRVRR